jgi:hypothetical protein
MKLEQVHELLKECKSRALIGGTGTMVMTDAKSEFLKTIELLENAYPVPLDEDSYTQAVELMNKLTLASITEYEESEFTDGLIDVTSSIASSLEKSLNSESEADTWLERLELALTQMNYAVASFNSGVEMLTTHFVDVKQVSKHYKKEVSSLKEKFMQHLAAAINAAVESQSKPAQEFLAQVLASACQDGERSPLEVKIVLGTCDAFTQLCTAKTIEEKLGQLKHEYRAELDVFNQLCSRYKVIDTKQKVDDGSNQKRSAILKYMKDYCFELFMMPSIDAEKGLVQIKQFMQDDARIQLVIDDLLFLKKHYPEEEKLDAAIEKLSALYPEIIKEDDLQKLRWHVVAKELDKVLLEVEEVINSFDAENIEKQLSEYDTRVAIAPNATMQVNSPKSEYSTLIECIRKAYPEKINFATYLRLTQILDALTQNSIEKKDDDYASMQVGVDEKLAEVLKEKINDHFNENLIVYQLQDALKASNAAKELMQKIQAIVDNPYLADDKLPGDKLKKSVKELKEELIDNFQEALVECLTNDSAMQFLTKVVDRLYSGELICPLDLYHAIQSLKQLSDSKQHTEKAWPKVLDNYQRRINRFDYLVALYRNLSKRLEKTEVHSDNRLATLNYMKKFNQDLFTYVDMNAKQGYVQLSQFIQDDAKICDALVVISEQLKIHPENKALENIKEKLLGLYPSAESLESRGLPWYKIRESLDELFKELEEITAKLELTQKEGVSDKRQVQKGENGGSELKTVPENARDEISHDSEAATQQRSVPEKLDLVEDEQLKNASSAHAPKQTKKSIEVLNSYLKRYGIGDKQRENVEQAISDLSKAKSLEEQQKILLSAARQARSNHINFGFFGRIFGPCFIPTSSRSQKALSDALRLLESAPAIENNQQPSL